MPKMTFSLDASAAELLRETAARTRKPQSLIVREAIAQYAAREDMLSAAERERLIGVLQRIKRKPPTRAQSDVDRELQEIRRSRRMGWSRPVQ